MKKLMVVLALVMSVATLAMATAVTVDYTDGGLYPGGTGNPCNSGTCGTLVSGSQSQVTLTPEPLQQIITENNITVPASIGVQANGGPVSTVGTLNFTDASGSGVNVTQSGNTGNVDLSNITTNQGNTNATNITNVSNSLDTTNSNVTNLSNTVNSNSTDISGLQTTVANHTTQINQNTSDISTLQTNVSQNTSDITTLNNGLTTTNTNVTNLSNKESGDVASINNMSDPTTVLNKTVNGNTAAIANETTRAVGAEGMLQNNINSEAATRAAADQALQNQINNVNAQAQDNTNRIDRLEQTKYLLEPSIRLYDDKYIQVLAFDDYDVRHTSNFAAGLRLVYKLGPSYEEKLLKKTNPEIARLLAANVSHDVAERDAVRKQLAEDRALIAEQSALLKQLSARDENVVLSAKVSKSSTKMMPTDDEDLLKTLDAHNDEFAGK